MLKKSRTLNSEPSERGLSDPYWFLEATVHQEGSNIFNLAYRLCQNREEANEIAQAAFLKTLENYRCFKSRFHVYAFLCRATFCIWKSRTRHRRKQPKTASGYAGSIYPEATLEKKERLPLIQKELAGLPASDKFIILLRDAEGKSYLEIACILKWRYHKVESRLAQARKQLYENMLPNLENPAVISPDCHQNRALFSARLDGLLLPNLEESLDKHLQDCRECRKKIQEMRTIQKLLSAIDPVKPPDDFGAAISKLAKKIIARKPVPRYRLSYVPGWLGSAALILILFIVLYPKITFQNRLTDQPPIASKNRPKPIKQSVIAEKVLSLETELFRSAPPPHTIIRNEQEWANIWRLQNAGRNISAFLPEVNFNSKMVVVIISQDDKSKYTITKTEENKDGVIIFCEGTSLTNKNPPLPLYQFQIVTAKPTVTFRMFRK